MVQRTSPLTLSHDDAKTLGVEAGQFCETPLLDWHRDDPWCAPLVVAGPSEVFDFTEGYDPSRKLAHLYGVGRYDEDRADMYKSELFATGLSSGAPRRTVHMGIDIGAPEGTPIFAPLDGEIFGAAMLKSDGDYGGTILLRCVKRDDASDIYMLFGHLSYASVATFKAGDRIAKGDLLGWLGGKKENGGWNPHLHWQLSRMKPLKVDLPGAVTGAQRALARRIFPDPTPLFQLAIAGWRA